MDVDEVNNCDDQEDAVTLDVYQLTKSQDIQTRLLNEQIRNMVSDVKISEEKFNSIKSDFINEIIDFISCQEFPETILDKNRSNGEEHDKHNFDGPVKPVKQGKRTAKPSSVSLVGSNGVHCGFNSELKVYILAELPQELFSSKDYCRKLLYFQKKWFYTMVLANRLSKCELISSACRSIKLATSTCPDQFMILIRPSDYENKCDIYIRLVPESSTDFSVLREINQLYDQSKTIVPPSLDLSKDISERIIAYHNTIVGQDVIARLHENLFPEFFQNKDNIKNSYVALKIWLRKRNLNKGLGNINNFLMRMFIIYLYITKRINDSMNCYQLLRTIWKALAESEWDKCGITLANYIHVGENEEKPSLQFFHKYYPVVFIDLTGYVNLAGLLQRTSYLQVKMESSRALQILQYYSTSCYEDLFVTEMDPLCKFDHVIRLKKLDKINDNVPRILAVKLDICNNEALRFFEHVLPVLQTGLGNRVEEIVTQISPISLEWNLGCKPPSFDELLIGIKLHPENALRLIDVGPPANYPEALNFRKFWSNRSELRRFEDGAVYECVAWADGNSNLNTRRLVVRYIVEELLNSKFGIKQDSYTYISNEMELFLCNRLARFNNIQYGTGEESALKVLISFNKLANMISDVNCSELNINSCQGISPVFRYTDLVPPLPFYLRMKHTYKMTKWTPNKKIQKKVLKYIPSYVTPVEAIIHFNRDSNWPADVDGVRESKYRLICLLSEKLTQKYYLPCRTQINYIDILKDGYVFRLHVYYPRELLHLKKRIVVDGNIRYLKTEKSQEFENKFFNLPLLTKNLHQIHASNPAYGPTCCLAKRWLNSHLIDYYLMPHVCVDLLIASLFLTAPVYPVVIQPRAMFIRFLKLLAYTNWSEDIVVVNFDRTLTSDVIRDCEFKARKDCPNTTGIVIITPNDKTGIVWTKQNPSLVLMAHISKIALNSLKCIEQLENGNTGLKEIFKPYFGFFDLKIVLKEKLNTHIYFKNREVSPKSFHLCDLENSTKFPPTDFDPIEFYLNDLRRNFGHLCIFFHNYHGGNNISVLLKPDSAILNDICVEKLSGYYTVTGGKVQQAKLNIDSLIAAFKRLGNDIVKSVQKKQ